MYQAKYTNTTQTHSQCEVSSPLPPHLITGKASARNVAKSKIISKEVLDSSQVFCFCFLKRTKFLHETSRAITTPHTDGWTTAQLRHCLLSCFPSQSVLFLWINPLSSCHSTPLFLLFPSLSWANHMYTYSTTSQGGCPQSRNRGLVLANGRL